MHHLIPIEELDKLTDLELIELEARLRNLILTVDLHEADLRRCLASLSNVVYILAMRGRLTDSAPCGRPCRQDSAP